MCERVSAWFANENVCQLAKRHKVASSAGRYSSQTTHLGVDVVRQRHALNRVHQAVEHDDAREDDHAQDDPGHGKGGKPAGGGILAAAVARQLCLSGGGEQGVGWSCSQDQDTATAANQLLGQACWLAETGDRTCFHLGRLQENI